MPNWREAVLEGVKEAVRLHRDLGTQDYIEQSPGCVDVFGAIIRSNIALRFRPLKGLLGAYLAHPSAGILVTTERNLAVQRFTGAHELGHAYMKHDVSLDDTSILDRAPFGQRSYDAKEAAADAFAASFLIPKWLLEIHADRQKWNARSMSNPLWAYQMSLRIGASYEATCRSLERYKIVDTEARARLVDTPPKKIKQALLNGHSLDDWHSDVWLITEADRDARLQGGPGDVFTIKLRENSGAGYLWQVDQLEAAGFSVLEDKRDIPSDNEQVGGAAQRTVVARLKDIEQGHLGRISLIEGRPWDRADVASEVSFVYELFGKESGLPRAERPWLVAA